MDWQHVRLASANLLLHLSDFDDFGFLFAVSRTRRPAGCVIVELSIHDVAWRSARWFHQDFDACLLVMVPELASRVGSKKYLQFSGVSLPVTT
ncbi:hypothetical protein BAUCODRAFT_540900 [Baudoinia panamericana UAMH 10762]|uniref:Uncharacterized protein n=1 Tax=Baudoinia panamericana (strain UAMH 10762) TaxID=717646 RepID=M2LM62_BAUPA|nr:uncharacterized protein BAUCODRAFT_540900 [Baudoinia panamericana UAMH 10762]EMC95407.1 hypothetical protein BAUCODRAFT_540900 [Baudoinia panamericana UAMH 10762]